MYSLSGGTPSIGAVRETFAFSQLNVEHSITQPKATDFEVDNKFVFEVGGSGKGTKQIDGLQNAFILKDNLEYPGGNAIPLWMIGLTY
jgi:hypothetical protein